MDPGNASIDYYRSAVLQEEVPGKAPIGYIVPEFDGFADTFDSVMGDLEYQVPRRFGELLERRASPDRSGRVLDLGCGTGLCGLTARPYAKWLCGVDLSPRMLARARQRKVYDELVESEMEGFLAGCDSSFDLVLAGDSLIYIGDLKPVLWATRNVLDDEGALLVSLELSEVEDGSRLSASGRYQHGRRYVQDVLRSCRLWCEHAENFELRMECGEPVKGLVVVAKAERGA